MGDANLVTPPAHAVSLVRPAQYRPIRGQQSVSHKADHFASSHFLEPGGTKRSFHCIFSPARQSEDVPLCLVTRLDPCDSGTRRNEALFPLHFFFFQFASQQTDRFVSSHSLDPGGTKCSFHLILCVCARPLSLSLTLTESLLCLNLSDTVGSLFVCGFRTTIDSRVSMGLKREWIRS